MANELAIELMHAFDKKAYNKKYYQQNKQYWQDYYETGATKPKTVSSKQPQNAVTRKNLIGNLFNPSGTASNSNAQAGAVQKSKPTSRQKVVINSNEPKATKIRKENGKRVKVERQFSEMAKPGFKKKPFGTGNTGNSVKANAWKPANPSGAASSYKKLKTKIQSKQINEKMNAAYAQASQARNTTGPRAMVPTKTKTKQTGIVTKALKTAYKEVDSSLKKAGKKVKKIWNKLFAW